MNVGDKIRLKAQGTTAEVVAICGNVFAWANYGGAQVNWCTINPLPAGVEIIKPESPDDVVHRFRDSGNYLLEVSRDGRFRTVHGPWVECYWAPEVARLALMKEKA